MSGKVFFLGSGFSKAIDNDFATLKELLKKVYTTLKDDMDYKHRFNAPIKDIEAFLTYLVSDLPFKTEEERYQDHAMYLKTIDIIQDEISSVQDAMSPCDEKLRHPVFSYFFSHADDVNIISTNYDCLVEMGLNNLLGDDKVMDASTLYQYPMLSIQSRQENALFADVYPANFMPPHLIKLHGSTNWFWSGINPSDPVYYSGKFFGKSVEDDPSGTPCMSVDITAGLKPYIIPPVMDKNLFYNHIMIKALWQHAKAVLAHAREIYIIGFSFPTTDMSIRFLFQQALRGSRNLPIYVVNKVSGDKLTELKNKYASVFGKDSCLNFEFCRDADVVSELAGYLEEREGR
jgi:hypothetical protein